MFKQIFCGLGTHSGRMHKAGIVPFRFRPGQCHPWNSRTRIMHGGIVLQLERPKLLNLQHDLPVEVVDGIQICSTASCSFVHVPQNGSPQWPPSAKLACLMAWRSGVQEPISAWQFAACPESSPDFLPGLPAFPLCPRIERRRERLIRL
jgi:hypothetical protein